MRHSIPLLLAGALASAGAMVAPAANAQVYTTTASQVQLRNSTSLFAGPGYDYPRVEYLRAGQSIRLYGCLSNNAWCDVSSGYARGWVDAGNLVVYRYNRPYGLYESRSWYAYPFVNFIFGSYWNDHYRGRTWYNDRNNWNRWDRHDRNDRDWRNRANDRDGRPNWNDRDRNNDGRRDDWRTQDRDRDGIPNNRDRNPTRPNPGTNPDWRTRDRDRDGVPNIRDRDRNNDGRIDSRTRTPGVSVAPQPQPRLAMPPRPPMVAPQPRVQGVDNAARFERRVERPAVNRPAPPIDRAAAPQPARQARGRNHEGRPDARPGVRVQTQVP